MPLLPPDEPPANDPVLAVDPPPVLEDVPLSEEEDVEPEEPEEPVVDATVVVVGLPPLTLPDNVPMLSVTEVPSV